MSLSNAKIFTTIESPSRVVIGQTDTTVLNPVISQKPEIGQIRLNVVTVL